MYNYFIIFKPKNEDEYRMYTNQIFTTDKDGEEFALQRFVKKITYKVVEYNSKNFKDYWK